MGDVTRLSAGQNSAFNWSLSTAIVKIYLFATAIVKSTCSQFHLDEEIQYSEFFQTHIDKWSSFNSLRLVQGVDEQRTTM
jgi:hypothetical protein